ncbi:MAG: T9SS type A sorting domain-containing protein, partial [Chitinophagaceae bacterium]
TSASNKYTVDISGSVSGWKFFKNVMSSGGVLGGVKSVVSLNNVGKYMNIFTPSGVSREYASAIAPETDGAEHGYGTKPTRVLTMRQYGEAWNKPFVNAFEPTTSTTSTIQSIEHILNGSKNVGAKVVSIVNGESITDYIISHEDNTSTYTDAALNFSFTGRFGILRLIQKNNVTQSNLYIGEGVSMTYQNRSLNANSDDNGFLNAEALPVQLVHFSAKANSNNVQLAWETALEINNKNFTVYHSIDGIHFNEIAEIPSKNQPSTYQFIHTNPSNKTNYYKLIQADNDGRKSDLGLRLVNFQSGNQKTIFIYPNPVQGVVNINYYSNAADKLLVQIFDITGKVIQETTIPVFQDKNQYSLPLNKQIIAGMYLMKITSKNASFSERLLVK